MLQPRVSTWCFGPTARHGLGSARLHRQRGGGEAPAPRQPPAAGAGGGPGQLLGRSSRGRRAARARRGAGAASRRVRRAGRLPRAARAAGRAGGDASRGCCQREEVGSTAGKERGG